MPKKIADSGALAVDVGQWQDELLRLGRKNDAGHSARELGVIWGVSNKIVLRRLQQLVAMGRLVVGRRSESRIDGVPTLVPVYTVRKVDR